MAKKCICAGDLRHLVQVQEQVTVSDGGGGSTLNWNTVFEAWADIQPANAYERAVAMQLTHQITHKITMRYDDRIDAKKRILFNGRLFNIVEVLNKEERNIWLQIKAIEGVAT